MTSLEKRVYAKMLQSMAKKDEISGKEYIDEDEYNKLFISQDKQTLELLKEINISLKKKEKVEKVTRIDRSPLVRDLNYGEQQGYETTKYDVPEKAELEFDESDNLHFENYQELDQYLEDEFIPSNVEMKQKVNKKTGEKEIFPSVQLNKIIKLRLSELEVKHIVEYLGEQGIKVRGVSQDLSGEFENYDSIRTYKTMILPKPLSRAEQDEKFALYAVTKDPIIREQLVLTNLRLVPYFAWKGNYEKRYGVDFEDLVQYGFFGLNTAIDKYDVTRGYAFSTFAHIYIRKAIFDGICEIKGVKNNNNINMSDLLVEREEELRKNPEYMMYIGRLARIEKQLEQEYGRKPTNEELAKEMGLSIQKLEELLKLNQGRIGPALHMNIDDLEDKDVNIWMYGDLLYDENETYKALQNQDLKKLVEKLFKEILTPREEEVLKMRFGLNGEEPMTLEKVGMYFGLTRERIRHIELKAIRKIRMHTRKERKNKVIVADYIPESTEKRL